jgi:hypothetical protein
MDATHTVAKPAIQIYFTVGMGEFPLTVFPPLKYCVYLFILPLINGPLLPLSHPKSIFSVHVLIRAATECLLTIIIIRPLL